MTFNPFLDASAYRFCNSTYRYCTSLSIPFWMLHPKWISEINCDFPISQSLFGCFIVPFGLTIVTLNQTLNPFSDASLKEEFNAEVEVDLSIPFRMLPMGCSLYGEKPWASLNPFSDASQLKPKIINKIIKISQSLFGCFFERARHRLWNRKLSIPFRMLRGKRSI